MPSPSNPLKALGAEPDPRPAQGPQQHTEILILPEGKVLVHNLTPVMATILEPLNPHADEIRDRVAIGRDQARPGSKDDRHL